MWNACDKVEQSGLVKVLPGLPGGSHCQVRHAVSGLHRGVPGWGGAERDERWASVSELVSNLQSLAAKLSQLKIAFEWRWKHNSSEQRAAGSDFPRIFRSSASRLTGAKSWSCVPWAMCHVRRWRQRWLRLEVVAVSRWPKKVCQVFDKDQVHLR